MRFAEDTRSDESHLTRCYLARLDPSDPSACACASACASACVTPVPCMTPVPCAGKDYEDKRSRDRYVAECKRLLGVLNQRLATRHWIMGDD